MPIDWDAERDELNKLLFPFVRDAALDGVRGGISLLPDDISVGIDFNLVDRRAVEWARRYTYDLVAGITDTGREFLQASVSEWTASGEPLQALADVLEPRFGALRAGLISATEVTRAFAEGNLEAWRATDGAIDRVQWNTVSDASVCEICDPLDRQTGALADGVEGIGFPPAHVGCRCFITGVGSDD